MKRIIVTFIAATTFSTAVFADTDSASVPQSNPYSLSNTAGFFVSGNLGYGKVDFQNQNVPAKDLRGFTYITNVGYQFCRYVALELGYTHFHAPVNAEASGWSLIGKGIYPLRDQFDVFGKLGVMRLHTKDVYAVTRDRVVPQLGLGASYNVNANIALTLQGLATLAASNQVPATYGAYAGASYKFTV